MAIKTDTVRPAPQPVTSSRSPGAPVTSETRLAGPPKKDEFSTEHTHSGSCGCGMPKLSPEQLKAVEAQVDLQIAANKEQGITDKAEPRVIDVYMHVINKGTGVANGDVSQEMIDAQITVLNDAYKDAGFEFRLVEVDRTTNSKWFTAQPGTSGEIEMKETLRKGGADALNIYTTQPGGGLLGWATFPSDYKDFPLEDGIVLLHSSLPGGSSKPFNEGDTGTHEVGHWMGLYHTWNQDKGDGQGPTGDFVDDTAEHSEPNFGKAPVTTDTMPDKPGFDPVKNFMNYTDDDWMDHFTQGQNDRMNAHWDLFRAPAVEEPTEEPTEPTGCDRAAA